MFDLEYWQKRPSVSVVMTLAILAIMALIDYLTGPRLNLDIAYFLPIIFAASTLGRGAAIAAAILSDVETVADQMFLVRVGEQSGSVSVINIILRLIVFVFVAELTYRLIRSASDARRAADELRKVNDELNVTYQRLNEDILTAGVLQSNVLEFDPPRTSGCEVGACLRMVDRIGGDFADAGFVDGMIFACVADIAGKGIPAALFSTLLKHLLIDAHRMGLRSGDVVTALNSGLSQTLPHERFVTLFYIEVDPVTGQADYVSAGHLDGLLFRSDTSNIEALPATGPILTLHGSEMKFSVVPIQFDAGDTLVLYTDGATESKTPSGDQLGEEPIRQLTVTYASYPAQEMAERICDGIESAAAGAATDDLTVLCIKMTSSQEVIPGLDAPN